MQISIIEFSLDNFKVFKNKATFSMLSRKNERHTFSSNGENLLRTSFIYGPNASGKTSILDAFKEVKKAMLLSANNQEDAELPFNLYLGSSATENKPITFELIFSVEGIYKGVYRYGFSFFPDRICKESLYRILESGSDEMLFSRDESKIEVKTLFKEAKILIDRTRKQSLFLSVAAQFNIAFASEILSAIRNTNIISGTNSNYKGFTLTKFKDDSDYKSKILEYLKTADFCISDGETKEVDVHSVSINDVPGQFSASKEIEKGNALFLKHPIRNESGDIVDHFELPLELESVGTQKFLSILGPIIDTLKGGKVLLIDEFDNSLHPFLTKFIVDLFESTTVNKNNAQLIVTTHDTSLLSYKDDLIKDQFWFTEKDEFGAARLFSLAEFELRNDTEYAKKYLEGRFGALPFISPVHD